MSDTDYTNTTDYRNGSYSHSQTYVYGNQDHEDRGWDALNKPIGRGLAPHYIAEAAVGADDATDQSKAETWNNMPLDANTGNLSGEMFNEANFEGKFDYKHLLDPYQELVDNGEIDPAVFTEDKYNQMRAAYVAAAKEVWKLRSWRSNLDPEAQGLTDNEWIAKGENMISWVTQNSVSLADTFRQIKSDSTPDTQKRAFAYLLEVHDHSKTSGRDVWNFFKKGLATDPLTIGGVIGSFFTGGGTSAAVQTGKEGMKRLIIEAGKKTMTGSLIRQVVTKQGAKQIWRTGGKQAAWMAAEGTIEGASVDAMMQGVKIETGLQQNYNPWQTALAGGIGFVAGDIFGGGMHLGGSYVMGRGRRALRARRVFRERQQRLAQAAGQQVSEKADIDINKVDVKIAGFDWNSVKGAWNTIAFWKTKPFNTINQWKKPSRVGTFFRGAGDGLIKFNKSWKLIPRMDGYFTKLTTIHNALRYWDRWKKYRQRSNLGTIAKQANQISNAVSVRGPKGFKIEVTRLFNDVDEAAKKYKKLLSEQETQYQDALDKLNTAIAGGDTKAQNAQIAKIRTMRQEIRGIKKEFVSTLHAVKGVMQKVGNAGDDLKAELRTIEGIEDELSERFSKKLDVIRNDQGDLADKFADPLNDLEKTTESFDQLVKNISGTSKDSKLLSEKIYLQSQLSNSLEKIKKYISKGEYQAAERELNHIDDQLLGSPNRTGLAEGMEINDNKKLKDLFGDSYDDVINETGQIRKALRSIQTEWGDQAKKLQEEAEVLSESILADISLITDDQLRDKLRRQAETIQNLAQSKNPNMRTLQSEVNKLLDDNELKPIVHDYLTSLQNQVSRHQPDIDAKIQNLIKEKTQKLYDDEIKKLEKRGNRLTDQEKTELRERCKVKAEFIGASERRDILLDVFKNNQDDVAAFERRNAIAGGTDENPALARRVRALSSDINTNIQGTKQNKSGWKNEASSSLDRLTTTINDFKSKTYDDLTEDDVLTRIKKVEDELKAGNTAEATKLLGQLENSAQKARQVVDDNLNDNLTQVYNSLGTAVHRFNEMDNLIMGTNVFNSQIRGLGNYTKYFWSGYFAESPLKGGHGTNADEVARFRKVFGPELFDKELIVRMRFVETAQAMNFRKKVQEPEYMIGPETVARNQVESIKEMVESVEKEFPGDTEKMDLLIDFITERLPFTAMKYDVRRSGGLNQQFPALAKQIFSEDKYAKVRERLVETYKFMEGTANVERIGGSAVDLFYARHPGDRVSDFFNEIELPWVAGRLKGTWGWLTGLEYDTAAIDASKKSMGDYLYKTSYVKPEGLWNRTFGKEGWFVTAGEKNIPIPLLPFGPRGRRAIGRWIFDPIKAPFAMTKHYGIFAPISVPASFIGGGLALSALATPLHWGEELAEWAFNDGEDFAPDAWYTDIGSKTRQLGFYPISFTGNLANLGWNVAVHQEFKTNKSWVPWERNEWMEDGIVWSHWGDRGDKTDTPEEMLERVTMRAQNLQAAYSRYKELVSENKVDSLDAAESDLKKAVLRAHNELFEVNDTIAALDQEIEQLTKLSETEGPEQLATLRQEKETLIQDITTLEEDYDTVSLSTATNKLDRLRDIASQIKTKNNRLDEIQGTKDEDGNLVGGEIAELEAKIAAAPARLAELHAERQEIKVAVDELAKPRPGTPFDKGYIFYITLTTQNIELDPNTTDLLPDESFANLERKTEALRKLMGEEAGNIPELVDNSITTIEEAADTLRELLAHPDVIDQRQKLTDENTTADLARSTIEGLDIQFYPRYESIIARVKQENQRIVTLNERIESQSKKLQEAHAYLNGKDGEKSPADLAIEAAEEKKAEAEENYNTLTTAEKNATTPHPYTTALRNAETELTEAKAKKANQERNYQAATQALNTALGEKEVIQSELKAQEDNLKYIKAQTEELGTLGILNAAMVTDFKDNTEEVYNLLEWEKPSLDDIIAQADAPPPPPPPKPDETEEKDESNPDTDEDDDTDPDKDKDEDTDPDKDDDTDPDPDSDSDSPIRGFGDSVRSLWGDFITINSGSSTIDRTVYNMGSMAYSGLANVGKWGSDTFKGMKRTPGGRTALSAGGGLISAWLATSLINRMISNSFLGNIPFLGGLLKITFGVFAFLGGMKLTNSVLQGNGAWVDKSKTQPYSEALTNATTEINKVMATARMGENIEALKNYLNEHGDDLTEDERKELTNLTKIRVIAKNLLNQITNTTTAEEAKAKAAKVQGLIITQAEKLTKFVEEKRASGDIPPATTPLPSESDGSGDSGDDGSTVKKDAVRTAITNNTADITMKAEAIIIPEIEDVVSATHATNHDGDKATLKIWLEGDDPIDLKVDHSGNWVGQSDQGQIRFVPSDILKNTMNPTVGSNANGYADSKAVRDMFTENDISLGQIELVSNSAQLNQDFDIRKFEIEFDHKGKHIELKGDDNVLDGLNH